MCFAVRVVLEDVSSLAKAAAALLMSSLANSSTLLPARQALGDRAAGQARQPGTLWGPKNWPCAPASVERAREFTDESQCRPGDPADVTVGLHQLLDLCRGELGLVHSCRGWPVGRGGGCGGCGRWMVRERG